MSVLMFDFHNLIFRTIFTKDVGIYTPEPDFQLWRYLTFNSIFEALKIHKNATEVILAMDDTKSWRKVFFPRYKENRRKSRDKQVDVDWQQLFNEFNSFAYDLKTLIPFKLLKVKLCEADDVIGVLCQDKMEDEKSVVVISNDEDYLQLLYMKNVKVYNPMKREYRKCKDTELFITEKCLLGQSKDNIFNIKTPDDWGLTPDTDGKRKPGFGPAALKKVMDYGWEKWLKDNELEDRFNKRNKVLMDFRCIPQAVRSNIIKAYENYEYPDADNIYKFFSKNKFRGFLDEFTSVENRLLRLY